MKEKYFKISKEHALRAGLDETLRTEVDGDLVLSEKDVRNISLTIEEKVAALGGVEYVESVNEE